MPRTCSICGHPDREAIEKALLGPDSFRVIAGRFHVSRSALERHKAAHLPTAMVQAQAADNALVEFGVLNELKFVYGRAVMLFNACDAWLQDPEDPTRYEINPRAEDINVVYSWQEVGQRGSLITKRRKEKLSALLRQINQVHGDWTFEIIETRTADPRELVLKAATTLRDLLTMFQELVDFKALDERIAAIENRLEDKKP